MNHTKTGNQNIKSGIKMMKTQKQNKNENLKFTYLTTKEKQFGLAILGQN